MFSISEAYLIENGKLTAPLKDVNSHRQSDPMPFRKSPCSARIWRSQTAFGPVGKKAKICPVGVGCPTIRISGMTVGGTDAHNTKHTMNARVATLLTLAEDVSRQTLRGRCHRGQGRRPGRPRSVGQGSYG